VLLALAAHAAGGPVGVTLRPSPIIPHTLWQPCGCSVHNYQLLHNIWIYIYIYKTMRQLLYNIFNPGTLVQGVPGWAET